MMFVDDIVLVAENLEEVDNRLDEWKLVLEGKGLRSSRNKTEWLYMILHRIPGKKLSRCLSTTH